MLQKSIGARHEGKTLEEDHFLNLHYKSKVKMLRTKPTSLVHQIVSLYCMQYNHQYLSICHYHLFHFVGVSPSGETQLLAQSLQHPNTYYHTTHTLPDSGVQFHQFIYTRNIVEAAICANAGMISIRRDSFFL